MIFQAMENLLNLGSDALKDEKSGFHFVDEIKRKMLLSTLGRITVVAVLWCLLYSIVISNFEEISNSIKMSSVAILGGFIILQLLFYYSESQSGNRLIIILKEEQRKKQNVKIWIKEYANSQVDKKTIKKFLEIQHLINENEINTAEKLVSELELTLSLKKNKEYK